MTVIKSIRMIGMSALAAGLGLLAAPVVARAQDSVFVTATGNVGIGTANPGARLEVSGGEVRLPPGQGGTGFTHFNLSGNGQNYIRGTTVLADTGGNVGIGTTTPAAKLEVSGGEVRFPAGTSAAGFTHFNFSADGKNYIRGTTIIADNGGNVGIGTNSPVDKLQLFNSADVPTVLRIESTSSGVNGVSNFRAQSNTVVAHFRAHGSGRTINHFGVVLGGWSEMVQDIGNGLLVGTLNNTPIILGTNNTNRLQIDGSTGAVTIAGDLIVNGTFSNPSSRELKENFAPLDPSMVLKKFAQLPINEWSYKSDGQKLRHVGPTVEDFRSAFGLGTEGQHIFPTDVQGMTMVAVQGLYHLVQEKDAQIAELQKELREIKQFLLEKGN